MEFSDERLLIIMEKDDIKKEIERLEKNRHCLPYSDVIRLKELKKRNLLLKDKLYDH